MQAVATSAAPQGSPMDSKALERYADLLDELERTDPQSYKQLVAAMEQQLQAAGVGPGGAPTPTREDADAALLDMLKQAAGRTSGDVSTTASPPPAFSPRFPGDKVMDADGLKPKTEGMHIDVQPGFVIKTLDIATSKKVFVNVCYSDAVQTFSEKKQLDDQGNEQEGIHVPLSLGAPHEVTDKKGQRSLAFDVAVNTKVVEDCKQDKTGAFRNFVCELAIEYIDQKYKVKLDARYKLPRLTYAGELPPPRHYIRKAQVPIIQEVSPSSHSLQAKKIIRKTKSKVVEKTATARYEVYEEWRSDPSAPVEKRLCERASAVESGSKALSREIIECAGERLTVKVVFESAVTSSTDVEIELRAELATVKAAGHRDLNIFLPYPVMTESATVTLDRQENSLTLSALIDKRWDDQVADQGSAPWLLAQALNDEADESVKLESSTPPQKQQQQQQQSKSLADMFHLAMPLSGHNDRGGSAQTHNSMMQRATQWDPVDEDEELPEDRFHRKDMMSMHILEQRKMERVQKAKEAEEKRQQQRAEVQEKQRKAREAGKTWREMYPDEPETTYIDVEDIVREEKANLRQDHSAEPDVAASYIPTEEAKRAAAAWSEDKATDGYDLKSAMAFELL